MKVLLANPRGFCAGVERAIRIVELALVRYGPPVYVRHGIVHNQQVIAALQEKGAIFVANPSDAPANSVMVFSAHGVSPAVRREARDAGHQVVDATCPLVTKVHLEARRYAETGNEILLIGHVDHVEVEGTRGEAPEQTQVVEVPEDVERLVVRDPNRLAVLTQTTLSVDDTREVIDALRARFPKISTPHRDDICYATQNRQDAVKQLAARADLVFVVGSPESSNGMRLVETARRLGCEVIQIESAVEIDRERVNAVECIGITAGAAVPEPVVEAVVARIAELYEGAIEVEEMQGVEEAMHFSLPAAVRGMQDHA